MSQKIHIKKCTYVQSRLDKVARAGLAIWITELDMQDENVNSRADRYGDIWL